jgi:hypothetical protein
VGPCRDSTRPWHPPVHSHDRHLASVLIRGSKHDVVWRVDEGDYPTNVRSELYTVRRRDINSEVLAPSGRLVVAERDRRRRYVENDFLSHAAGVFHEIPVVGNQPFATLCVKSDSVDPFYQSVVDATGHPPRLVTRT